MRSMRFALCGLAVLVLASCAQKQQAPSKVATESEASDDTETQAESKPAEKARAPRQKKRGRIVAQPKATPEAGPTPEQAVRRMADFYKELRSFEVRADMELRMQGAGMNKTMKSQSSVVFQRPNRLAIRPEKGDAAPMSVMFVSDGKTMYTLVGILNQYTKSEAPKSFDRLQENPFLGGAPGGPPNPLLTLLASDPYGAIMDAVKEIKDLGNATVDGQQARHLQFIQDQFNCEAWIATGPDPLLLRVSLDMSKVMAASGGGARGGGLKLSMSTQYVGWKWNISPSADAFVFTPPKGAKESNKNPIAGLPVEPKGGNKSPLVGKAAPPIDLEALNGKRFKLADHRGKDVVMVDMWATWCPPCRQELPILVEVARDYKSKGVEFYAVDLGEDKKKVAAFLKKEKLTLQVALDKKGTAAAAYQARVIPQLVLIDKRGIVQSVHVGYSSDIKQVLHKELDKLLADSELVAEDQATNRPEKAAAPQAAKAAAAAPKEKEGLERAWSVSGSYSGAAWDPHSKLVFAIKRGGQCDVIGTDGAVKRSFKVEGAGSVLRPARLRAADQTDLVSFEPLGHAVVAFSTSDGAVLWREHNATGVNDVCAADLDGDQRDSVIIGYSGFAGLHVLRPNGKPRWETTDIVNVWNVAAGNVKGEKKPQVLSTSALGKVHVFSADGKSLNKLSTPFSAMGIRVAHPANGEGGDKILITGSVRGGESLAALDETGRALWNLQFPHGVAQVDSLAVASTRPWAACGAGGRVFLVDLAAQAFVTVQPVKGRVVEVAWAVPQEGQAPLLLVADGNELAAFRVKRGAGGSIQAQR